MIDEEKKKELRGKILNYQLQLENVQDDYNYVIKEIKKVYEKVNEYREKKDTLTDEEFVKIANDIFKKTDKVIDLVGRDNFIFYDDGDINYIWSDERKDDK